MKTTDKISAKKRFGTGTISAATALLAAALIATPANAQVVLNVNNWAGPTYPLATEAAGLCEDIKTVTEGRVVCNILPKPIATPAQTFDAVVSGIVDIGYTVHGYTEGRFVLTKAVEFPLFGDTAETMSVAYQRVYDQMLADANEHEGVKVLAVHVHGPGQIFNIRKEIKAMSDLNGLKMRVGGGVINDVSALVGVVPILKPATEVYELLSTGVADGVFFAKDGVIPYNLPEVVKYTTFVPGGMYNLSFGWFANPDKWNSIPEADRALIEPLLGETLARRLGAKFDEADGVAPQALADAGIPVTIADEAFLAELAETTEPLRAAWFEDAAKFGVDGQAVLDALKAEVAKVEAAGAGS
ncbi:TRAP transporter substrate-binding protein [Devosia sp.]|uniref:TRAP transporter substrate-binding protein n=1 Tax=Devosia sp. TaxID=1871048 RepID=UPI002B0037DB|nr:TRAP transporter substrate-binding protein [Devosia sp.]